MTYLELVQKAMRRAGVREDLPTTLVGATGIVSDFADYVADTYRKIQTTAHGENWFFRQALDQTITLVVDQDNYSMPSGLCGINLSTVSVYETAKTDERQLHFCDYQEWRMFMDTREVESTQPTTITIDPANTIYVWPQPDKAYTLRFDGILDVDEMTADADEPIIPEKYQWTIIWGAVMRYAKHHEDGAKLADAMDEYKPELKAMVEHQLPETRVITGHLRGDRRIYGS